MFNEARKEGKKLQWIENNVWNNFLKKLKKSGICLYIDHKGDKTPHPIKV